MVGKLFILFIFTVILIFFQNIYVAAKSLYYICIKSVVIYILFSLSFCLKHKVES